MSEQQHKDLKENVLQEIRSGKLHMKPRYYFLLQVIILIAIAATIFILAALLLSFLLFSIKVSGNLFLLGFGLKGFEAFFMLFPWKTFAIFTALLIILEAVIKKFKFGYRSPLIYLIAGILGLIIASGIVIAFTSFHRTLFERAREHRLPVVGNYYVHVKRVPRERGILRGTVISIDKNIFVVKSDDNQSDKDDAPKELYKKVVMPLDFDVSEILRVGDKVFVAATTTRGDINAYGIKKILPSEE